MNTNQLGYSTKVQSMDFLESGKEGKKRKEGREGGRQAQRGKKGAEREGRDITRFLCGNSFSGRDMCLPACNWLSSPLDVTCQDTI